jgi:hypothetical protein
MDHAIPTTSYGSTAGGASSYGGQARGPAPTGVVIDRDVGVARRRHRSGRRNRDDVPVHRDDDTAATLPPQHRHELRTQHHRLPAPQLGNLRELLDRFRLPARNGFQTIPRTQDPGVQLELGRHRVPD